MSVTPNDGQLGGNISPRSGHASPKSCSRLVCYLRTVAARRNSCQYFNIFIYRPLQSALVYFHYRNHAPISTEARWHFHYGRICRAAFHHSRAQVLAGYPMHDLCLFLCSSNWPYNGDFPNLSTLSFFRSRALLFPLE